MKIAFVVPFTYKWKNYANVKSHFEYLKILGHKPVLFNLSKKPNLPYEEFDQVWLMGSGAKLSEHLYHHLALNTKVKIIAFGWSDPNMFDKDHAHNCHAYFTNDLKTMQGLSCNSDKPHYYYYQTSCDKRYHKSLNLEKTTDILVYGTGQHKYITNRNQIVNKLRRLGFKIKVFGRGWDSHEDTRGFIEGSHFITEINRARLVLDITNEKTAFAHRVFESSACGTPVITLDRPDVRKLFDSRHEIILYKDFKDMVDKLHIALNNPIDLALCGQNAQQRCYRYHDVSIRIQKLLKIIKENVI